MTDDKVLKTGIVKFYSPAGGYGFIVDDETGTDIFCTFKQFERMWFERIN